MRRRVRTGQLVIAEVTAVAVVVAAFAPRWIFLGVAVLAGAVLVATFGRAGGRWWYEAVALSARFRRRRQLAAAQVVAAAVDDAPPPVAWLRTLAPGLSVRPVAIGAQPVAVGADADGWFAVADVGPLWDDLWDDPDDGDPRPFSTPGPAIAAPNPWAPSGARGGPEPAADQTAAVRLRPGLPAVPYRDLAALLDQVSAVQIVLTPGPTADRPRLAWVAVRIAPADALATERTGGISALERTVAAAAAKAVRALEPAGWAARPVTADGLAPVLAEATGLDGPPQEHWSWWRSGRTVRTHYAVDGWTPAHGTLTRGVSHLSVRLDRGGQVVLAAVTAAPAALRRTCQEAVAACAAQAVRLVRLDGEQAPAAWASAPTAAPPPPARPLI